MEKFAGSRTEREKGMSGKVEGVDIALVYSCEEWADS
jgi:hypothetical protein